MIGVLQGGKSEFTQERSRFLGFVYPILSLDDVRLLKRQLKQDYHDASHIPFAYVYEGQMHFDDDGEPSGAAGAPLAQLLRQTGVDCGYVVVVRYFGGRKLGAKRLREAFKTAAAQALALTTFGAIIIESEFSIVGPLEEMGVIHRFCMETGARIININYNKTINATLLSTNYDEDRYRSYLPESWVLNSSIRHTRVVVQSVKE